ncbi:MAG: acyltransferase [Deltaproteobacteria bacterium]|uniref:Acyltransferase n=1 Tax=Candidatus Zymogenus saltonus TaxID=2844893 RepID=A0A9D8KJ80_9DELT|nr:acyltransferase [Candidatus Zymogenus saltonus]
MPAKGVGDRIKSTGRLMLGRDITLGPLVNAINVGFGCTIGDDVLIDLPALTLGDYVTIERGSAIRGYNSCTIGHNVFIGEFSMIDTVGNVEIGNNVGIGAHSQLLSHQMFGDRTFGSRFSIKESLTVGDDVWFANHCIVLPIKAEERSMALAGSVVTDNMKYNRVYAGVPAKDVTEATGPQFDEKIRIEQSQKKLNSFLIEYESYGNNLAFMKITDNLDEEEEEERLTLFSLKDRLYLPRRTEREYNLMKYLLYDKAKFLPYTPPKKK